MIYDRKVSLDNVTVMWNGFAMLKHSYSYSIVIVLTLHNYVLYFSLIEKNIYHANLEYHPAIYELVLLIWNGSIKKSHVQNLHIPYYPNINFQRRV